MTPDNTPALPDETNRHTEGSTPKLADRLSALVGQAAVRQDDSVSAERLVAAIGARVDSAAGELRERIAVVEAAQAGRMSALETLVAERLATLEAAVATSDSGQEDDVKAHVDEVGGALILRLDEVLAGLAQQVEETKATLTEATRTGVEETRSSLAASLDEARHQLAVQLEETRGQLAGQVDTSQAALTAVVKGVDATVRGHVGDLAAGVLELGSGSGLTREDLDAALADLRLGVGEVPLLFDGVAQAGQLDAVTAMTGALRDQLDDVTVALGTMRADFNGLQAAIERRVDDAALALAETLVAVITSLPAARPAPAIFYDDEPSELTVPEGGSAGDWAAEDPLDELAELAEAEPAVVGDPSTDEETVSAAELDEAAVAEESLEQAEGVDEGGVDYTDESGFDDEPGSAPETSRSVGAAPAASSQRRKGIFRR